MTIISPIAGILLAEGLYRLHQKESCPTLIKQSLDSLTNALQETPLAKIVFEVFVSVILSHSSLSITARCLKDRIICISTLCHWLGAAIGTYRISIPLLLGTSIYLGRRHFLIALIKQFEALYNTTEELRDFFASAAAHPDEMIAKAQQELEEGVQGICESIRYILFANDPAIIRTIDREIGDFEKHLHSLKEKMPLFEKKLEKAQEHLTKTRQDLTLQLSLMEQKSSELEELFKKLDNESSELGLENFREFLGHQDLVEKQQQFNAQLETMQDLANKIDLIMSGIRLVKQADNEEIKAIRRWNIYIGYTPLPTLENAFLIACDMPHLSLKMFNEIVYNTPQKSDDL